MNAYMEAYDHGDHAVLHKLNKLQNMVPFPLAAPTLHEVSILSAKFKGVYVETEVLFQLGGNPEKIYVLVLRRSEESPTGWTITMFYLKTDAKIL
uniref:Uncharacterized protein n=1 Tax=Caenorhabditis japonica TaxID=281687 RepID=A0A8R1ERC5_CAEJA